MTLEDSLRTALSPRYELLGPVGAGGMGAVFEALDTKHGRRVAVKVARRPGDPGVAGRFREEVDVLVRLRHPAILPVHDSGQDGDLLYFVTPLAEGSTLRARLEEVGPLDLADALPLLADVAGALDHAHRHGVIHRDVKPDNVLLESGRAVLADFGIARALRWPEPDVRHEKRVGGTAPYMSPEQMADPEAVGPASDIYALGCVAYEVLTGEIPFEAPTGAGVLAQKLKGPAAVGPGLRDLPAPVRAAILRCLAHDPAERYTSAGDFVADLDREPGRGRFRVLAAGAAVAVVAFAAVYFVGDRVGSAGPVPEASAAPRVVVGPIENLTGDEDLDGFVPSAVDYLTRTLQQADLVLHVVPTETALGAVRFAVEGAPGGTVADPIRAVAEETAARFVVTGDLFRGAEGLGFRIQVSDTRTGRLLGAPDPVFARERGEEGVAGLLEDAAAQVLGALALVTDERLGELDPSRPPAYAAYRVFSEGLDRYLARDDAGSLPLFHRAHVLDSSFVTALLYEALANSNLGRYAVEDSLLALAEDRRAEMTPVERHWVDYRKAFLRGDGAEALRAIRAAAALAPGSRLVYNLATVAMEERRVGDAVEALESLPSDRGPLRGSATRAGLLATCHHLLGDYESALEAAREARRLFAEQLQPRYWEAAALAGLGRVEEARRAAEVVATLPGDGVGPLLASLASELAAHGHATAAASTWEDAVARLEAGADPPVGLRRLLALAEAYLATGRYAEARSLLDRPEAREAPGLAGLEAKALRGRLAARSGDPAGARALLDELAATEEPYLPGLGERAAAMVAAALGDHGLTLDLLRRGFARGLPYGEWVHNHPAFLPLHRLPAYAALVEPVD